MIYHGGERNPVRYAQPGEHVPEAGVHGVRREAQPPGHGAAFGTRAADSVIRLRAHDGRNADIQFTQPPGPGVWRPTTSGSTMSAPWLGFVTPLLAHSATQFAPPAPPALTSARYARDFAEVKALGSLNSTARTPDQTSTAQFFSGNPLVLYNAALRDQVSVRHLDIADAARMFAAIDMSVADAEITVWNAKYIYGLWRPVTAIGASVVRPMPGHRPPLWTGETGKFPVVHPMAARRWPL